MSADLDRRSLIALTGALTGAGFLAAAARSTAQAESPQLLRGTGDLGIVIERADGALLVVDTSARAILTEITGLGDLSHASAVFSRDGRHAFVFGRDGGLTKVDLLSGTIAGRVVQAGNTIGGAISQDGRLVAASNYEPGGVRVFAADTLEPVADIKTEGKVVGLVDAPNNCFVFSLFDAGAIWLADLTEPAKPAITRFDAVGREPYDALITPDGRFYLAGLFGEDGFALLDLWQPENGVRRVLDHYGRGDAPLPVYKMPHLEGWAAAGDKLFVPAIGRHEVLIIDRATWQETGRIAVLGQPVFVRARPDGREVWVNFALPDNGQVQVIDTLSGHVTTKLTPGRAVLHIEFTPRGEAAWVSSRDDGKVVVYDTRTKTVLNELSARSPSGIFFTARAQMIGL